MKMNRQPEQGRTRLLTADWESKAVKAGINVNIKEELYPLADLKFKEFTVRLMPGVADERVIGVRLPQLRKLAKKAVKEGWKEYMEGASDDTYEEIMLQGMVLGYAKETWDVLEPYVTGFLPKIDNWSVCDSFCSGLKSVRTDKDRGWRYLEGCLGDDREYVIRFGIVMMIFHYMEEKYAEQAFEWFDRICHSGYYVKMAKAWAVSIYFVNFPEITMEYLKRNCLDDWTYNKALQKIRESRCVDRETKDRIRLMKRE
ncbi:DNA alkylation repair protein [Clostridium sp. chh4-2]|uniref:DNA alkylation repair protein n=1 Tax=Clostridium sp. chh4-2 TaxID=2067550 RepID=UPI001FA8A957|nr:DNA alkylation repair protein [Clostridium sp. chh4-2]